MTRVTADEVKVVIETELTDPIIEAYISSANVMVTNIMSGSNASSDLLKEIERWLTAHMIAVSKERVASKEGAGGAYIEYSGEFAAGLASTSYGQMVKSLDSTGRFANAGSKRVVFRAIAQNDDA